MTGTLRKVICTFLFKTKSNVKIATYDPDPTHLGFDMISGAPFK